MGCSRLLSKSQTHSSVQCNTFITDSPKKTSFREERKKARDRTTGSFDFYLRFTHRKLLTFYPVLNGRYIQCTASPLCLSSTAMHRESGTSKYVKRKRSCNEIPVIQDICKTSFYNNFLQIWLSTREESLKLIRKARLLVFATRKTRSHSLQQRNANKERKTALGGHAF